MGAGAVYTVCGKQFKIIIRSGSVASTAWNLYGLHPENGTLPCFLKRIISYSLSMRT